jgi:hypothetical protein
MKGTMNSHIPSTAGTFRVVREKKIIRGRSVRTCTLVFTTHDGFVGESIPRNGHFAHREAYENALAARAAALFRARGIVANALPKPWERCDKPAPVAALSYVPHPEKLTDSSLFSEVERRGYEVCLP